MEDGENGIQLNLGLSVLGKVRRKSLIDINSAPQVEDGENGNEGQACRLQCDTTTSDKREVLQADKRRQDAKRKREEKRLIGKDNANNNFSSAFEKINPSRVVFPGPTFPPFGNVGGFSDGSHCFGPGPGVSWEEANHNCNNGGSNNGSGGCSSSMISENRSISSQGGCSSDSGSHLSISRSGKTELDTSSGSETQEPASSRQFQYSSGVDQTSQPLQRTKGVDGALGNNSERVISSNTSIPCQVHLQEEGAAGSLPIARMNPSIPQVASEKVNKPFSDMGKPPKPLTHNHNAPALSHMPYVSTTGNGPNGKTVTGFLYRYTKTEVSIICVCHGKLFSPTEFVEHAGGVDILHPLKHITVVPSALA